MLKSNIDNDIGNIIQLGLLHPYRFFGKNLRHYTFDSCLLTYPRHHYHLFVNILSPDFGASVTEFIDYVKCLCNVFMIASLKSKLL